MYSQLSWGFVVLVAFGIAAVSAGPDHHALEGCSDFRQLSLEQRHKVRDTVQALQAVESYIGQLNLGRPLPRSSEARFTANATTLQLWKSGNSTKLVAQLGSSDVALSGRRDAPAKLAEACLADRLHHDGFSGRPVVSILLNYFKRPRVVSKISANMRASCAAAGVPCELVVNVDNPHEAAAWAHEAAASGGFVVPVFSANLHEARGYNRAARLARGRYLMVWQDDQVPPQDGRWLVNMVRLFDAYPQVGVLGMNCYRLCKHMEPTNRWGSSPWAVDPKVGTRWTFAQAVDFAPMAIRASIFHAIGGLDEGLSRPGDCGIWGDWELSFRAWMDGWQVAHFEAEGRSGDGEPGTTHQGANGEKCWGRQQHVASNVFHLRYDAHGIMEPLCDRVWLLNLLTHKPENGRCPYGSDETRFGNCTLPPAEVTAAAAAELKALEAALRSRGTGAWTGSDPVDPASASAPPSPNPAPPPTNPAPPPPNPAPPAPAAAGAKDGAAGGGGEGDVSAQMDINPVIVRGRLLRRQRWR